MRVAGFEYLVRLLYGGFLKWGHPKSYLLIGISIATISYSNNNWTTFDPLEVLLKGPEGRAGCTTKASVGSRQRCPSGLA